MPVQNIKEAPKITQSHSTPEANPNEYYQYLLQRSWLALIYRKFYLYPRLCRFLSGTVLDVGSGIGDFLQHRPNTVGADINPYLVDHCRRLGLEAHLLKNLPMSFADHFFDGVVMDNVLEHLDEPHPILSEAARLLKPGGRLIIGVPGIKGFAVAPDHKQHYDESRLRNDIPRFGFECITVFHVPFRSQWLERHFSQYCLYGVFQQLNRSISSS